MLWVEKCSELYTPETWPGLLSAGIGSWSYSSRIQFTAIDCQSEDGEQYLGKSKLGKISSCLKSLKAFQELQLTFL